MARRMRKKPERRVVRTGVAVRQRGKPSLRTGRTAEVIDAALTLFARLGYHGTSMNDIAAALRMRAPSLYNHVAAKQHLLRDIIVATHEVVDRELRAAIASSSDVVEQLRRAVEVHVRYHMKHPREWRVANRELEHLEEPARSQVRHIRRAFEEVVIALIERGVAAGRFSASNPKLTAFAIFRLGSGVGQWYRPGGEFSDAEIAYYYGDLALRIAGAERAAAPRAEAPNPRRR